MANSSRSAATSDRHTARVETELDMQQSLRRTEEAKANARPESTKKAYDPKIKEFKEFCRITYDYEDEEDRCIVTGEKAHYFLLKRVSYLSIFTQS